MFRGACVPFFLLSSESTSGSSASLEWSLPEVYARNDVPRLTHRHVGVMSGVAPPGVPVRSSHSSTRQPGRRCSTLALFVIIFYNFYVVGMSGGRTSNASGGRASTYYNRTTTTSGVGRDSTVGGRASADCGRDDGITDDRRSTGGGRASTDGGRDKTNGGGCVRSDTSQVHEKELSSSATDGGRTAAGGGRDDTSGTTGDGRATNADSGRSTTTDEELAINYN